MREELLAKGTYLPVWATRLAVLLDEDVREAAHDKGLAVATEMRDAWLADPIDFLATYVHTGKQGEKLDLRQYAAAR